MKRRTRAVAPARRPCMIGQVLRQPDEETLQEGEFFGRFSDEAIQTAEELGACSGTERLNERLTFGDNSLELCFQRVNLNLWSLGISLGLDLLSEFKGARLDGFELGAFGFGKLWLSHPLNVMTQVVPALENGFEVLLDGFEVLLESGQIFFGVLGSFCLLPHCLGGFTDLLAKRLEGGQLDIGSSLISDTRSLVCDTHMCSRVCSDGGNAYKRPKTDDEYKDNAYQPNSSSCHAYLHNSMIASGYTYWTVKVLAMFTTSER